MTADENLRLIREIEANRAFLLAAYRQNPGLLARAEPRIRQLFSPLEPAASRMVDGEQLPYAIVDLFNQSERNAAKK